MNDQIVLVVGGSGGIGEACARLFAKAGAKVVLAARNREKADRIAGEINDDGGDAYAVDVDVSDMSSVYRMVDKVTKDLDRIDVLVNAFGLGMIQSLMDVNPRDAKELVDVNVYGTILVTQAVMRHMLTWKKGTIIMFPGILGKEVMKNSSVYSASKFAITGFTRGLIEETRRGNIKFSLIYAGSVATEFWDNPNIDFRVQKDKMLSTEEVAKATYYAATQEQETVLNEVVIQPQQQQMT